MLTDEFKREPRYVVFKLKDIVAYLPKMPSAIGLMERVIHEGRLADGKSDFRCVVVESDWPEYEPTWKAIEARMTGRAIEAKVGAEAQDPVAYMTHRGAVYGGKHFGPTDTPLYATPQPPALRSKFDLLVIERDAQAALISDQQADVEKQTEISNNFAAQVRQQDETIASLRVEVDHRQSLLRESNRNCAEHAGVVWERNVTIARQAERIAELELRHTAQTWEWHKAYDIAAVRQAKIKEQAALLEKCEKALLIERNLYREDDPDGEPDHIYEALAAIAAQKGGA